jgi:hypothetical protein
MQFFFADRDEFKTKADLLQKELIELQEKVSIAVAVARSLPAISR